MLNINYIKVSHPRVSHSCIRPSFQCYRLLTWVNSSQLCYNFMTSCLPDYYRNTQLWSHLLLYCYCHVFDPFNDGQNYSQITQETYFQDFVEILKRSFQNFSKILNICFVSSCRLIYSILKYTQRKDSNASCC